MNTNWRNWYLVAAHELDGSLDLSAVMAGARANFGAPDTLAALPARAWVQGLTTRLIAEAAANVTMTMAFAFPDTKENYGLEIRRGVAQFYDHAPAKADVAISFRKAAARSDGGWEGVADPRFECSADSGDHGHARRRFEIFRSFRAFGRRLDRAYGSVISFNLVGTNGTWLRMQSLSCRRFRVSFPYLA